MSDWLEAIAGSGLLFLELGKLAEAGRRRRRGGLFAGATIRAGVNVLAMATFCVIWTLAGLYLLDRMADIQTEHQADFIVGFIGYVFSAVLVGFTFGARAKSYISSQRAYDGAMPKIRSLRSELDKAQEMLVNNDAAQAQGLQATTSASPTLSRLQSAVADFPSRYPQYESRPPKLDDDIRPWLKSAGYAKNDREAFVFGSIIAEHYGL